MRLASCIALELVTGLVLIGGVASSAVWALAELRGKKAESAELTALPAEPATAREPAGARIAGAAQPAPIIGAAEQPQLASRPAGEGERGPPLATADTASGDGGSIFAGRRDEELLAPLREGRLARVKIGTCCTSLNMRVDFDNGARAAFKPVQTNLGSMPRKEIAAYRVDRLLRLGKVPPALGRRFRAEEIRLAVRNSREEDRLRLENEMLAQQGAVDGELSWWIPALSKPKLAGLLIDSAEGVNLWQRYLTLGNDIPEAERALTAQISNVLLFDFLINNIDRWSGGNVLASEDGSTLYYMDNTMAFRAQPRGHSKVNFYLRRSQKFSRSLVSRLRALRLEDLREVLAHDLGPFQYLLSDAEVDAVLARRDAALEYVDRLIARSGEEAVLVFP